MESKAFIQCFLLFTFTQANKYEMVAIQAAHGMEGLQCMNAQLLLECTCVLSDAEIDTHIVKSSEEAPSQLAHAA
jgi:hypothetical protein